MKTFLVLFLVMILITPSFANVNTKNNINSTITKNHVYRGSVYNIKKINNSIYKTVNIITIFHSDLIPNWYKYYNISRIIEY